MLRVKRRFSLNLKWLQVQPVLFCQNVLVRKQRSFYNFLEVLNVGHKNGCIQRQDKTDMILKRGWRGGGINQNTYTR